MEQGRYADAKDIYSHVYIAQKKKLGRDHAETMATQACIGAALNCLGNYADALKMFQAVLLKQRKRQDHSNGDPVSLIIKFNVATLLCENGEYADASKQLECVLKESEEAQGHASDQKFLLQIQTWMAVVLVKQGRYDEAIDLYMALMDKSEQVRGPHHRKHLLLKCDHATVLSCRGDHETAQNILQEVFEHQKRTMCYSLLDLAEVENSLANVKVRLDDDTGSAIKMYAHIVQVRSAHLGLEHPLTLNTKHAWAHALSLERKFEESTQLLKDVLSGRRKTLGEYHADTILTLQYLSEVVFEQGDFEMAARIATDVIELRRRRNPLETVHRNTVRNQQLLDLSIAKLPKGFPFRLPARNFSEAGSVSKSQAPKYSYPRPDQAKGYLEGNQFCCCKPKNWTQLIAAIHIILCGLTLPLNFFKLLISTIGVKSYANGYGTTLADADCDDGRLIDGYDNDNGIVNHLQLARSHMTTTAVDFICTVAGCILYAGAHYQKPGLILMWLIVEGFTTGLFGIFLIYLMYLISTGTGGEEAVVNVIFLIPITAIGIFCFYIVSRHRQELNEYLIRRREELPTIQFYSENIA